MSSSTPSTSDVAPVRPRRRRSPPPSSLPRVLRPRVWLAFGAVVLAVWAGLSWFEHRRAHQLPVQVVRAGDGQPVENVHFDLFACATEPHMPSPSPQIGEIDSVDSTVVLDSDEIPDEALALVRAPGFGATYAYLALGRANTEIEMGQSVDYRGRVVQRSDGLPVEGARVQLLGGGPRGVLLAEAATAENGRYVLPGISEEIEHLTLRVLADGFSVKQLGWYPVDGSPRLPLDAVQPVTGRVKVRAAEGAPRLEDCSLRVLNLPGVVGRISADDGSFVLDSLPPPATLCTLLLAGIGDGWTHVKTQVRAGDADVEIEVIPAATLHGRVIDETTNRGVRGAAVFHEHGPTGFQVVRCDSGGRFQIGGVPSGIVELTADFLSRSRGRRSSASDGGGAAGSRVRRSVATVDVVEGRDVGDVVIVLK